MAFDMAAYEQRIGAVGLKHFKPSELLVRTSSANRFGTRNSKPPMKLWDNVIPTAIVLDAVRAHFGKPVRLISGYRSEAYNQASTDSSKGYTGRAKTSQHMAFSAFDFTVDGVSCSETSALLQQWENTGKIFYSPAVFVRHAEKVSAGQIPFGELPMMWHKWPFGVWFSFSGYIKAYTSDNFTHVDTRGKTEKSGE